MITRRHMLAASAGFAGLAAAGAAAAETPTMKVINATANLNVRRFIITTSSFNIGSS